MIKKIGVKFLVPLLVLAISLIYSCANQIPLTGGPKDETPPYLDTSLSTPNYQIFFEKQTIELYFDEFINLKDPIKQVIVTPPLDYFPSVKAKLKKVSFEFGEEEILKEDVTYVINFGESLTDFSEGNKLENFTMVLSTGSYIDSLSIRGSVLDAKTQEPAEEYLVMLYESLYDSIVYKEKPFYFASTDKSGTFQINNLRADTFKLFVLNDQNLNYTYDKGEEIGFIDEYIYLNDTADIEIDIESFKENSLPRYLGYDPINKGLVEIEFDQIPNLDSIEIIGTKNYQLIESALTKLDLYYAPTDLGKVELAYGGDTLSFRINTRSLDDLDTTFVITPKYPTADVGIHPDQQLSLKSNYPIDTFDIGQITLLDTARNQKLIPLITLDEKDPQLLYISGNWKSGADIMITLLPGAVKDIWAHTNDSTSFSINIASKEDYGSINLRFDNIPIDTSYHVKLLYAETEIDNINVELDTSYTFDPLEPGSYNIEIFEDLNNNGRWDPGNYLQRRQSERIFKTISLDNVKGNWTIDRTVDIKQLKSKDDTPKNREPQ